MVKVNVKKLFKFAHDGVNVVTYPVGEHEVPDDVGVWLDDNTEYGSLMGETKSKKAKKPEEDK